MTCGACGQDRETELDLARYRGIVEGQTMGIEILKREVGFWRDLALKELERSGRPAPKSRGGGKRP